MGARDNGEALRGAFMSMIEQNQKIITKYRRSGQPWPATAIEIARWAITNKHWDLHPSKVVRQCADQIAQAMRDEFITDPQGRRVRAKHAAPYAEQGKLRLKWDDLRTAEHTHMEMAFAHRRQQVVADCRQLKLDIESYNQNYNKTDRPIQGYFDFTDDLTELELGAGGHRHAA
jgi:hypothetical protein